MANDYYSRQGSYTKGTLARGDVVKSDFDALVTAWDAGETNIKRSLKLPNEGSPQTDWQITANAATRANNVIGFDSNGDLELQTGVGSWEGTWATSTAYALRDVVVDGAAGSNTDNLYICIVAHTSGTWSTDLAAAKWELMVNVSDARDWARKTDGIVDSTDYSSKAYAIGGTGVTTTASKGAAKEWATTTGGYVDTAEYSAKEYAIGTTVAAGSAKTHADASSVSAATSTTQAGISTAQAVISTTQAAASSASASAAATSESNAATSETNAASSASSAATSLDDFTDLYLGSKSSDPTLDNDGDALQDGALYWNTTNDVLMVYDLGGTTWQRTTPTATDQAHINTVSGISSDVTTVSGISANVTTVSGISANVTTVAGISSDVTSVAGDATDIGIVAGAISPTDNVGTVATNVANVNTTAGSISNVNTVAGSIADVNRYANEYTISGSAPSSPSEGDLWYDSTANILKYYNGTVWAGISGDTDVLVGNSASDTTPGYLSAKVAAGNNVSITTLNSGGNEQLQITASDNSAAMALALGG